MTEKCAIEVFAAHGVTAKDVASRECWSCHRPYSEHPFKHSAFIEPGRVYAFNAGLIDSLGAVLRPTGNKE